MASSAVASRPWLLRMIAAVLLTQTLPAVAASGDALLLMVTGDVRVMRSARDWTSMRPLARGDTLQSGDTVVTGDDGRAQLRFSDGALVTLQPRSRFRIDEYRFDADGQRGFFSLLRGAMRTTTGTIGKRSHDDYQLRTPTATVGVRGTEFEVEHTECDPQCSPGSQTGLRVTVHEGRVVVSGRAGTVELPAGSSVHVGAASTAPTLTVTRTGPAPVARPPAATGVTPNAPGSVAPPQAAPPLPPPPAAPAGQTVPSDFRRPGTEATLSSATPVAHAGIVSARSGPAGLPPSPWSGSFPGPARVARPTLQTGTMGDDATQPHRVGEDAALPYR